MRWGERKSGERVGREDRERVLGAIVLLRKKLR